MRANLPIPMDVHLRKRHQLLGGFWGFLKCLATSLEEVKAFIEILYLIIGYGPLRVMREFPGKRQKTFGLDNLTTKLLKKWMSKRTHGVAYRGLCVSLTSDVIGGSD